MLQMRTLIDIVVIIIVLAPYLWQHPVLLLTAK
jgi:hypothetical protein